MRYCIDGVLVVEGSSDEAFLSSFIDSLFVKTQGYAIDDDEIDFLKHSNKHILVLTDPDEAGNTIRKRIHELIGNCTDVYVSLSECNKNKKHGVAECKKEEIIKVLSEFFTNSNSFSHKYNLNVIKSFGIDSKAKRIEFCKKLHLGKCNSKTMIRRLNYLDVNIIDVQRVSEAINGNK